MILQRYLIREVMLASLMALAVFVGVLLALFLAELMGEAAQGRLPIGSVLLLLLLRLPEALLLVGPLALMVGLLMAIGRLGESSELAVTRASGLPFSALLSPLLGWSLLWSAALLLVSGWLGPAAFDRTNLIMNELARTALVSSIRPGQFDRLEDGRLTLYVGSIDRDSGALGEVFVHLEEDGESEVLSAPRGRVQIEAATGRPFLTLEGGHQLRHRSELDSGARRLIRFERNDIRLPAPEASAGESPEMALSLPELLPLDTPGRFQEWHWRLAAPLAAFLLALLALPLAQRAPRQGRFGAIVLALGIYLIYTNAVHASLVWLERREMAAGPGLWPLHLLVFLLVAVVLMRQWRRW